MYQNSISYSIKIIASESPVIQYSTLAEEEEAFEAANKPQPAGEGGRGRRGRGRGGRVRGGRAPPAAVEPELPAPPPVLITDSSEEEEFDSYSDPYNSDSSVSGDDYAYYGGYGRCYTCGMHFV